MKTRIALTAMLALTACGGEAPAPEVSLPASYDVVALGDIDTADKMTARCEADEADVGAVHAAPTS